jgi:hypothetical protein
VHVANVAVALHKAAFAGPSPNAPTPTVYVCVTVVVAVVGNIKSHNSTSDHHIIIAPAIRREPQGYR